MKKIIFIFSCLIVFLHPAYLYSQAYDETFAVQSISLSNQDIVLNHSFNALGNPALMNDKQTLVGISVYNRYFIPNLKQGGLGFSHRVTKTDAFGFAIQFDGTVNLRQTNIGLAYSKRLNQKVSAGVSIIYLNTFEQTIGTKNNILGKAGIVFHPNRTFTIGTTVYNPFAARLSTFTRERIPTFFGAGISYKLSNQVVLYAEYKLGLTDTRNLKLGLSYEPKRGFVFYAGYQNSNSPLSFGFSFKSKIILVHIGMQYQQVLGFSPAVGMEYEKE